MTAQCGKVFSGQGDVQMTPLLADGAVQTDDLAVFSDRPDVHAAGVPHLRFRDAAHGGKHHSRRNVLFLSEFPDGEKQIVPPVETDAVADKSAGCGHNGMLHR